MSNIQTPNPQDLPSASRLLRSTLIALVTAIVILVVAVLPAEYGVDPTGLGRVLGLTQMGEIKMSLAREAAADAAADAEAAAEEEAALSAEPVPVASATPAAMSGWTNETIIPLAPGEGKEVKLVMAKGAVAEFSWAATGGAVNYDLHGDSVNAPNSYYNYAKASGVEADSGSVTAAFDGSHGWFWRNRSARPVAITLRTRGAYTELKRMY